MPLSDSPLSDSPLSDTTQKTTTEKNWVEVGSVDQIPLRGARVVETESGRIALFRAGDGEIFALDDRCPHLGGPLSDGIVSGHSVTCPLHAWRFDLETGVAQGPDEGCAHRHDVRVVDELVQLRLLK